MADVTVLGAGGSTVTITLTSAANAAAAQTALGTISDLVGTTVLGQPVLEQFEYTGTGTVPATSGFLGGFVGTGAGDAGILTSQHISTVVNAVGNTTVIGAANPKATVVAGDGANLTYFNQAALANVTFGVGNSFLIQGAGSGAIVAVDAANATGGTVIESRDGSNTFVQAGDGSLTLIYGTDGAGDSVSGAGGNVNMLAGAGTVVAGVTGAATVPVTITGSAGSELKYLALGGSALINPGAGDVTVFGNVGTGTATVFGGSAVIGGTTLTAPAFTGTLTVVDGRGYFAGGEAGGNLMSTSTVAGSATLQGGGTGDQLLGFGSGQVLIAGAGAETLTGFFNDASVGGSTFFAGGGNATIFGNTGGGNTFGFGAGISQIEGRDEAALTTAGLGNGAANLYFDAASGGTHIVADFITGFDTLNLSLTGLTAGDATITAFNAGDPGNPFSGFPTGAGTQVTLTSGTTILFLDTNADGLGNDFKITDIT